MAKEMDAVSRAVRNNTSSTPASTPTPAVPATPTPTPAEVKYVTGFIATDPIKPNISTKNLNIDFGTDGILYIGKNHYNLHGNYRNIPIYANGSDTGATMVVYNTVNNTMKTMTWDYTPTADEAIVGTFRLKYHTHEFVSCNFPFEITIDGKVYEPVSKDTLTGRFSENNSPIEVNYQPKLNSKALEYQPKVNGKELRKPIEILPSNSQIGTPYNVVPKKLLIDGKLYIPINKDALTGKLLENNETINVEYKESKDYNDTFKQFKEIEKDVVYVSADKDKKVAYDKELENLSNLLKGEKDPSDIEKSVANLEKLKEALNGKANLLKAIEKAKEEISKLTYIVPQSDPILDMLDEPSIIDVEEITHIVEEAKELNNTVKEIVEVLDKHNENEVDYKKSTPEKKEEYNKKAKEILELLKDKNLTKEKALEKVKELNKVSDNLDGVENKQKQDAAISEIEKNTNLPKEVKEKLIKEIENTTSSEDLNKLLDKGKFIDKEIKENKNVLSKQVNVSNLSDKEKEEYNKALKDYENALSNPDSTKEDIEKAKATLLKFIKEKNDVQFAKGMPAILEKEEAFILEYKDENNKVIKTAIFPNSKKEDTDLLYPKELTSDNGDKYVRNSNNTYSLVKDNKPLEKPESV